ncbi:MAG: copper chaperone PCu(A)C [Pseudolabrys sp.]|nr:copper chaperone PCu(A)C [Pseudolabrys sp.]
MTHTSFIAGAVLAIVLAMPAQAEDVTAGPLKISAPWTRATPKGASVGGGYMKITNTGSAPDRLVSGSTDISRRFEIHEMSMDGGVMKMRAMPKGIELKPGQTIEFKPGGYHVMFVGLNKGLEKGQHVKATLQFEKAGKVEVDFTVEGIGAQSPGSAGGDHSMPGIQMKH